MIVTPRNSAWRRRFWNDRQEHGASHDDGGNTTVDPRRGHRPGESARRRLAQVVPSMPVSQLLVAHRQGALEHHLEQQEPEGDGDEDYRNHDQCQPQTKLAARGSSPDVGSICSLLFAAK